MTYTAETPIPTDDQVRARESARIGNLAHKLHLKGGRFDWFPPLPKREAIDMQTKRKVKR